MILDVGIKELTAEKLEEKFFHLVFFGKFILTFFLHK